MTVDPRFRHLPDLLAGAAEGSGAAVRLAHTGQLPPAVLEAVHDLLAAVFAADWSDEDWEHCLGGVHALAHQDGRLVGHGCLVQRRLLHRGRAVRAGYVEGVAVAPAARGRGHGAAVMAVLEDLARGGYDLAALATSGGARGFYRRRGWLPWRGPTWALTAAGTVRTPDDDDAVHVLPFAPGIDPTAGLTCDPRPGDPW